MSQREINKIRQEVKEKALAKMRNQWFKEYKKIKNAKAVCEKFGISRSKFYYWKKRIDLKSSGKGEGLSKEIRLMSYLINQKQYLEDYIYKSRNQKSHFVLVCKKNIKD